jgi:hypothetical protein
MLKYNTADVNKIERKSQLSSLKAKLRAESKGYCLNCKTQISFCGKPFTAEIACPKCKAVNVWEESQQPKFLKEAQQHRV